MFMCKANGRHGLKYQKNTSILSYTTIVIYIQFVKSI